MTVINAFHPDYVKTHMPEFLTKLRQESMQTKASQNVSSYVEEKRKTTPSHGTVPGISKKVIPAHMNRPKEMMVTRTKSQIMAAVSSKKRAENVNWGTVLPKSLNIPKTRPSQIKKGSV